MKTDRHSITRRSLLQECGSTLIFLAALFVVFVRTGPGYGLLVVIAGLLLVRNSDTVLSLKRARQSTSIGFRLLGILFTDLIAYVATGFLVSLLLAALFDMLDIAEFLGAPPLLVSVAQFFALLLLVGSSMELFAAKSRHEEFKRELEETPEESVSRDEETERAIRKAIGLRGSLGESYRAHPGYFAFARWYHRRPSLAVMFMWAMLTGLFTQVCLLTAAPQQAGSLVSALRSYYLYFTFSSVDLVLLGLPRVLGFYPPATPFNTLPSHTIGVLARFAFGGFHVLYIIALFVRLRPGGQELRDAK